MPLFFAEQQFHATFFALLGCASPEFIALPNFFSTSIHLIHQADPTFLQETHLDDRLRFFMAVTLEIINCIESMPEDAIIMADDLAHLCANPSTIYNTFSSLVHEGKLKRSANGVYVKQYREQPSVDEIVARKARRFGRRVKPGKQHHDEHHTEIRHKYWTNGRTTSFKLLSGGKPYATVLLQEQCRATAEKKRNPAQTIERSVPGSKAIPRAQFQTTETDSPASYTNSDSPNRVGWWHLVRLLTSELLKPFENCLTMFLHQNRILPNEQKSSIILSSELPPQFPHCRTANMRARLSCSYNSLHGANKDSLHRNYRDFPP